MDTHLTAGEGSPSRPFAALGHVESGPQRTIYVVATTRRTTPHAFEVASTIASEHGKHVTVLVSVPERVTITSARAGVYNLPVEFPDAPDTATPDVVRQLVAGEHRDADVRVTDARDARGFARVLPPSASVVLAGPIHRFFETPEQRLARKLTALGYDVIFLPCPDE
jgi:hypothetical protein